MPSDKFIVLKYFMHSIKTIFFCTEKILITYFSLCKLFTICVMLSSDNVISRPQQFMWNSSHLPLSLTHWCKQLTSSIYSFQESVSFEFPYKPLNFPPSCPDCPWCNLRRDLLYSRTLFDANSKQISPSLQFEVSGCIIPVIFHRKV